MKINRAFIAILSLFKFFWKICFGNHYYIKEIFQCLELNQNKFHSVLGSPDKALLILCLRDVVQLQLFLLGIG